MTRSKHMPGSSSGRSLRPAFTVVAMVFVLVVAASLIASAQTYNVIYNFTDRMDGALPSAGLTLDAAGNLYGTTIGDNLCCGTVFKLSKAGAGWVVTPLYLFKGGDDGNSPWARVVFGPDGALYGTTVAGGNGCAGNGCGIIFKLAPPPNTLPNVLAGWRETTLHRFTGGSDGGSPELGDLVFDKAGNMYGTASGGDYNNGLVFEMTPSYGGWTNTTLYSFTGSSDGSGPYGTPVFDQAGNLYGTALFGGSYGNGDCIAGNMCGTVYELTPSLSGWSLEVVHTFQGGSDSGNPIGGVIFGLDGYLYGTTPWGGSAGGGTVFSINNPWLSPYPLSGNTNDYFPGPWNSLTMDSAGTFYGTTYEDGSHRFGTVFRMSNGCGCGGCYWGYKLLYEFTGGSDGGYPLGGVTVDAHGNLYGTASVGGANEEGVVWEITSAQESEAKAPLKSGCNGK